jgi:nucleoside-diphosphate-sugar epimerase
MERSGIHVVLGASGGTGNAVARALHERGHRVRAVNRAGNSDVPEGIERAAGDVTKSDDLERVLEDATVVYHCAQPEYTRWAEEFPGMNRVIVDATAAAGAKLVFADNLYMYGPVDGPLTEQSPLNPLSKKGVVRRQLAEDLLAAHREGRLRVTISRASDYFGPRALDSAIGDRLFEAAIKGKKVPWLGSLDVPHTVSYAQDMGRAIALLGERNDADGRVWHLPSDAAVTGREFISMIADELGRPLRPTATSPAMVKLAGVFVPMIREINDVIDQWTKPFVSDGSNFERTFGPFEVTPNGVAIRETVQWYAGRDPAGTA